MFLRLLIVTAIISTPIIIYKTLAEKADQFFNKRLGANLKTTRGDKIHVTALLIVIPIVGIALILVLIDVISWIITGNYQ